jgi:hypothetical protein
MSGESAESIPDDAVLLRRIPMTQFPSGQIAYANFVPSPRDTDGLSLFLQSVLSAESLVAAAPKVGAGVAAATAGEIRRLGLSLVLSEEHGGPGHCHIPEIRYSVRSELPVKALIAALTELFARRIVVRPGLPDQ